MVSIKTAAVIAVLAMTAFAYGDDSSVAMMSIPVESVDECTAEGDVVLPETPDSKKTPMFGWCTDGDGGDSPYVASYVIDAFGTQWQDQCQNSSTLIEDTCGTNGAMYIVVHDCPCVWQWITVPGYGQRYAGKCQS